MMLIAGTLFAWAIWFRLLSNALFAALAAYLDVWASVVLGVLCVLGLYRPQQHADLYASLDQGDLQQAQQQRPEQLQQQHKQALQQHDGQEQRSPFSAPAFAHPQFTEDSSAHSCSPTPDQIHSWVQAAALHTPQPPSPPVSTCPSITSAPLPAKDHVDPISLESSSNNSGGSSPNNTASSNSSSNNTSGVNSSSNNSSSNGNSSAAVTAIIARAAADKMLQAYRSSGGSSLQHAAPAAAAAVWATSMMLAHRLSEPGMLARDVPKARRASTGVCLPPLEYEASAELQQQLEAAAPDAFICPLGRTLMRDPVFTPSGFTYHRPCILDWITRTGRDPAQDGSLLSPTQLCPNVNLRDQIASWLQSQGVET